MIEVSLLWSVMIISTCIFDWTNLICWLSSIQVLLSNEEVLQLSGLQCITNILANDTGYITVLVTADLPGNSHQGWSKRSGRSGHDLTNNYSIVWGCIIITHRFLIIIVYLFEILSSDNDRLVWLVEQTQRNIIIIYPSLFSLSLALSIPPCLSHYLSFSLYPSLLLFISLSLPLMISLSLSLSLPSLSLSLSLNSLSLECLVSISTTTIDLFSSCHALFGKL